MNRAQRRESAKIERKRNKANDKKAKEGNYIRCAVPANIGLHDGDYFTSDIDGHKQTFMAVVE